MMTKLTDKQKMFVEEYLVDLNATQAAIRAGYSEKTAKQMGCENLSKPDVQDAIQKGMDKRTKRTRLEADSILNGIASIAYNEEESGSTRLRGFELLGKHRVLFTDKIQHDGAVPVTKVEQTIVNPEDTSS